MKLKIDTNSIFLLGGYDLEMIAIRELLDKYELKYFDNHLRWDNAYLSSYKEQIEQQNPRTIFYAIELIEDYTPSTTYYTLHHIDHHNQNSKKPASLLQVLSLLDIDKLSREHRLIAANDSGYIPAMLCENASKKEITHIRQRDADAQGITDITYNRAKNDAKSRKIINEVVIICATVDSFAAITDVLYFEYDYLGKTIIYNDSKMVCYGFEKSMLIQLCKAFCIPQSSYYYGGTGAGYFGIKEGVLTKKQRNNMIEKLTEERPLYSSHIFMFPFRFDYAKEAITKDGNLHEYAFYYNTPIEERLKLQELKDLLKKENWCYEPYKIECEHQDRHLMYSEFAYFYDYSRDALYNREVYDSNAISSFFRKKDENDNNFYEGELYSISVLDTKDGDVIGETTYDLEIQGISLRIFHTGVAILSIELQNHSYPDFKDILRINDYGRRVYPQFIGKDGVLNPKKSFLPNSIKIGDEIEEKFESFAYEDVEIGKHIMKLLGESLFADKKSLTEKNAEYDKFYIQPSLDDRMFVLSWYGNDKLSKELVTCYNYRESDKWYEYVFVDGNGITVKNSMMKKKLLKDATYDRWTTSPYYETLYGITRYSFMCISQNSDFAKNVLPLPHMNTMYFQMATLLLANRTSILRFSDEIAALVSPTKEQKENTSIEEHTKKIEKLYEIYLKYYNRLYFKEVTHQDQGIELYDIGIRQMRIGEHVSKLDGKFEKLFNFENLKANDITTKRMNNLTFYGAWFIIPSFVISLFGLDEVKEFITKPHIGWVVLSIIVGGVVAKFITSRKEQ